MNEIESGLFKTLSVSRSRGWYDVAVNRMQYVQQGHIWSSFVEGIIGQKRVRNVALRVMQKFRLRLLTEALEKWAVDVNTSKAHRRAISLAVVRMRRAQLVRMFDEWVEFASAAVQHRSCTVVTEAEKELREKGTHVGIDLVCAVVDNLPHASTW